MAATEAIATQENDCVEAIRRLASQCHPAAEVASALAPLGVALYGRILKHNPANPLWFNRHRFIVSYGAATFWQYCLLHLCGNGLDLEDMQQFGQWRSLTPANPERGKTPGVEASTGPVGEGLLNAAGVALAELFLSFRFNTPEHAVADHFTYVLCSDDELECDVAQGAFRQAATLNLGKLICIGCTYVSALSAPEGWHVSRSANDVESITEALGLAQKDPRPSLILLKSGDVLETSKSELRDCSAYWASVQVAGSEGELAWNKLLERYCSSETALAGLFQSLLDGTISAASPEELAVDATQATTIKGLCQMTSDYPGRRAFSAADGICQVGILDGRDHTHAIAGIASGSTLHGSLQSNFSTSLLNSERLRPTLRLAAMMKLPVTYIWTQERGGTSSLPQGLRFVGIRRCTDASREPALLRALL